MADVSLSSIKGAKPVVFTYVGTAAMPFASGTATGSMPGGTWMTLMNLTGVSGALAFACIGTTNFTSGESVSLRVTLDGVVIADETSTSTGNGAFVLTGGLVLTGGNTVNNSYLSAVLPFFSSLKVEA